MKKEEPRTIAETVAFNIKKYRKNLGMTQENLASAIKTTKSAISKYELGRRFPDADTMDDLAKALGISPLFLIADEETAERTLETLNHGSRQSTPEHRRELEKMMGKEEGYLDKMSARRDWPINQQRLVNAFDLLNDAGQQKAVERVEELTEIPKYQRQPPQEPPAAPSEGTDTAPTENAATGPQEGK